MTATMHSRPQGGSLIEQFEYGLDAPICLTWELTYACNLACVHCLSSSGRRDPRELSTEQCEAIIDELQAMQVFYVNIGGGEPTIRPDFWHLLRYAVDHQVGVKFSTNGVRITPERAAFLASTDYVDVQISLDGATADVNDRVRGEGSYDTAIRALDTLSAAGFTDAKISVVVTRENVGKRMAILLFEKGKGEVVTAPVIRTEIGGGRVQISGRMTTAEANDTALLLRAGSLAAPMEIIEERTIGPSLGAENIAKGFNSVTWGFLVIVAFMCLYYMVFGLFSSIALGVNLLLLVAALSMLQATLTLPGMAAMALALGMAIDSNVLINERVREELRLGASPQAAIHAGYDRAWSTIFDSNITTLIAGVALLAFGSGPVRGFAVVHCLGILTSMFSAVFFSRGLVNLWYGRQKKLKSVSIGTVWRPEGGAVPATTEDKA
jgi:protein-export SecD/SecF family membrane protein